MNYKFLIISGALLVASTRVHAATPVYSDVDGSGRIHMQVWKYTLDSNNSNHTTRLTIPHDWVVVGGGVDLKVNNSALIAASYPDIETQQSWIVSTLADKSSADHALTAYAIGIKIEGISRSDMGKHSIVKSWCKNEVQNDSADVASSATIPDNGYLMISGGAKATQNAERGSAPVYASAPGRWDQWIAASKKASDINSPALTSCVVGIRKDLASAQLGHNLGYVDTIHRVSAVNKLSSSRIESEVFMENDYILTGVGAKLSANRNKESEPKVLLYSIMPKKFGDSSKVVAKAKEYLYPAGAFLKTYAIGVRLIKQ
ncbi:MULTISPECIES: hypothetical protein [unclassified Pseudoalteromonas]|uniref:hypothetical protein n=1 Tax=unclassified Pseudoalteromonas TaxID=194690 RepID=UPI002096EB8B|nr:hypothetical protein [Pseudoalteromonas sp. XMcav2-N]MCO7189523.1 hypothetical protein [Pseudoalteromonas sp. XMcav2-N]